MPENSNSAQQAGKIRFQWQGIAQLIVAAVVVFVAIYFARAPSSDALVDAVQTVEAVPRPTVNVVRPVVTSAAREVRTTGVVAVVGRVGVRARINGEVVFVAPAMRSGGSFAAGETLLRIDRRDHGLRLEGAQAGLRHAEARLAKQKLKGEAKSAEYRRDNPGAEVPPLVARVPQIAREQARVDVAQNALELAELNLSYTTVSLPFDGWVITSNVQVGQVVGPAMPLAQVFAKDAVEVEARISQEDANALLPIMGRAARVFVGGPRGQVFDVSVQRVAPVVDPQSRLVTLYLAFAEGIDLATLPRPGTFANISLEGSPLDGVMVLPEAAEQSEGSVWIVEEGALASVTLHSLGRIRAGWLVQAFDPGEGVVVGKVPGARAGLPVDTKPASSARLAR